MQQGQVVELTSQLILESAKLSLQEKLPLEDSIILATARAYEARFWTQDSDFENMDGVKYIRKKC
jgi:predicted nucleic acid-binding protein